MPVLRCDMIFTQSQVKIPACKGVKGEKYILTGFFTAYFDEVLK